METVLMDLQFSVFETQVGFCGVLWSQRGLRAVLLPEVGVKELRLAILARYPHAAESAPPQVMKRVIARLVSLLESGQGNFDEVELDLEGVTDFQKRVYEEARRIPPGATCSYGELAQRLGKPGAARAVGMALGRNPLPLLIPCHRVLAAGGALGGFTAHGGVALKKRLLVIERSAD
jgi:methylated-DNA-[protein]-cysteine S-methyltransferase